MGLFGIKQISEIKVAGQFVITIAGGVQEHWSSIAKELNQLSPLDKLISDDQYASFEFSLAVIAVQIQSLPNLLDQEQANRIRKHVLKCISPPDLDAYPRITIEEYQDAWDASINNGEPPFYGVASVLYDKLECGDAVELGGQDYKNPVLLLALSEQVVKFGGPWWKNIIGKCNIVP